MFVGGKIGGMFRRDFPIEGESCMIGMREGGMIDRGYPLSVGHIV